jgi:hypothetical protein
MRSRGCGHCGWKLGPPSWCEGPGAGPAAGPRPVPQVEGIASVVS